MYRRLTTFRIHGHGQSRILRRMVVWDIGRYYARIFAMEKHYGK